MVNKEQKRIGLVNENGVSIHHIEDRPRNCPVAFIFDERCGPMVNRRCAAASDIADVAGLSAAYDAYRLSLNGAEAPAASGFEGDQLFFLSFAQSWRNKMREPALRQRIVTDGHAPEEYRADTVRNLDAWYGAFDVKPGQKLYLGPTDRVRIW